MRKIFFLVALLSASIMSYGEDVNFALDTQGSSATASNGNAALAIDGGNGGDFFVDNVYFYTIIPGEGIEQVQGSDVQWTKVIRNGVLYLMHEGTMYDVRGQKVQ